MNLFFFFKQELNRSTYSKKILDLFENSFCLLQKQSGGTE